MTAPVVRRNVRLARPNAARTKIFSKRGRQAMSPLLVCSIIERLKDAEGLEAEEEKTMGLVRDPNNFVFP